MSRKDNIYVSYAGKDGMYVYYNTVPSSEWEHADGERALSHSFLFDTMRKIMGRTLTLIDASIHDKQQNKAMKDIIRNVFSDEMEFANQWAFDQKKLQAMIPKNIEPEELGTISVEEALGVHEEDTKGANI